MFSIFNTKPHHCTRSWVIFIYPPPSSHPISLRSILISFSHLLGLPSGCLPRAFLNKIRYAFLIFPTLDTCIPFSSLLDFATLRILGGFYLTRTFWPCKCFNIPRHDLCFVAFPVPLHMAACLSLKHYNCSNKGIFFYGDIFIGKCIFINHKQ